MILCTEEHAKKINSAVFPGQQGGPLEHVIAGKAVALKIAATEVFKERQQRTLDGAKAVADAAARAPATASTCSPAAPTSTSRSSTCASPSSTASRPRTGCTRSASPSTATRSRSTRARRWSRAACASARRRSPRAGCRSRTSPRSAQIIAAALTPDFEAQRADLAERVVGDRRALPAVRASEHRGTRLTSARSAPIGWSVERVRRPARLLRRRSPPRPRCTPVTARIAARGRRRRPAARSAGWPRATRRCSAGWRSSAGGAASPGSLFLIHGHAWRTAYGILAGAVRDRGRRRARRPLDLHPAVKLLGQFARRDHPGARRRRGREHHAPVRRAPRTSGNLRHRLTVARPRRGHERREPLRRRRRARRRRLRDRGGDVRGDRLRPQPRRTPACSPR